MGARGNGIMQFVVLLTDGLFSDRNQNSINKAATDFQNNGGRILSVGIGDSISHTNLLKMSGRADYVFHFPEVEEIYNSIIKESLHSSCTSKKINCQYYYNKNSFWTHMSQWFVKDVVMYGRLINLDIESVYHEDLNHTKNHRFGLKSFQKRKEYALKLVVIVNKSSVSQ